LHLPIPNPRFKFDITASIPARHFFNKANFAPTTQLELLNSMTTFLAQNLEQWSSSPFSLKSIGSISAWTGSGTYFVYIVCDPSTGNALKSNVSFSNGSATIDYDDMTNQSSLPAM
jgi:hypothetical protein